MEIVLLMVVGVLLAFVGVAMFTFMTDPQEIDTEEEGRVIKEKRRWWRRR